VSRAGGWIGPRLTRKHLIPIACALAALTTAGLGVLVSLRADHWDTTALVRIHDTLPIARLAVRDDPTFRLRHGSGYYDGAFFYAIARDPLATGEAHHLLDESPYYWGHPGYGWLAWLASAGGRPGAVPDALLAVGLLSMLVAGAVASMLAGLVGWTPWGGLVVALNPGLVFSVNSDTSEPLGAALLIAALVAYIRGARRLAVVLLASLCLVKEPLVLVPLSLGLWEAWRTRRPPLVAAAVVPALAWWVYLRIHLGAFPFGQGSERLTTPFLGWWQGLGGAASQSWSAVVDTAQLGQASLPLIVVVGSAIVVAALVSLRLRSPVHPVYLALAALYACITPNGVQAAKDLIRELAPVLTLLPFALVARARPSEPASVRTHPRARRPSEPRSGS
jgi:hypothetical protein